MTIAELLLPEFDQEMATTRRTLERVPDDKFAWKPHGKSFSMGDLASHIANMVTWTVDTMNRAEFDLAGATPEQLNRAAKNRAELVSWFDGNVSAARAAETLPSNHETSSARFFAARYSCSGVAPARSNSARFIVSTVQVTMFAMWLARSPIENDLPWGFHANLSSGTRSSVRRVVAIS